MMDLSTYLTGLSCETADADAAESGLADDISNVMEGVQRRIFATFPLWKYCKTKTVRSLNSNFQILWSIVEAAVAAAALAFSPDCALY